MPILGMEERYRFHKSKLMKQKQGLPPRLFKIVEKIQLGLQEMNKAKVSQGINDANLALSKQENKQYRITLLYFLSNMHDDLYYREERHKGLKAIPRSKNLQETKRLLDLAISECNDPNLLKQFLVNLGNTLDLLGRGVEAISIYDRALKIDEDFSMAKGNKAIALKQFADIAGQYRVPLYIIAYKLFQSVIDKEDVLEIGGNAANEAFKGQLADIEARISDGSLLKRSLKHKHHSKKGLSKFEKYYIDFCIKNNIFLNFHIHESSSDPAIHDPIFIEMITPIGDQTTFYRLSRYINQIKEDFAVARLQLVQSQFKNKELSKISNYTLYAYALDYSNFNIYYGLLKSSFGKAFNILDKIAEFLNEYCDLKIEEDIHFNSTNFWERNNSLRDELLNIEDINLYALYDIFVDFKSKKYKHLADIRNLIIHKKLTIFEQVVRQDTKENDSIDYQDMLEATIFLMTLTRAAIFYLINFVNGQEKKKLHEMGGKVAQMPVTDLQFV